MHFCILGPLHRAIASEDISPYGEVYLYNTIAKSNPVSKVLIGSVCLIINTLFYIKSVTEQQKFVAEYSRCSHPEERIFLSLETYDCVKYSYFSLLNSF